MLKFRFVPEETTKMRLLASAPGGHSNAAQVFVYIPLRTSTPFASSPARNGASRLHRQRPTPPWNLSGIKGGSFFFIIFFLVVMCLLLCLMFSELIGDQVLFFTYLW